MLETETALKRGILMCTVSFEVQNREKAESFQVTALNKACLAQIDIFLGLDQFKLFMQEFINFQLK